MPSAQEFWDNLSAAQKREIFTANVMVALGPEIRAQVPAIGARIKSIFQEEARRLGAQPNRSDADEKLLTLLQEGAKLPLSLEGIRQLEAMKNRAPMTAGLLPIVTKCFNALPAVLKFSAFGSLIKHNALSKFIAFSLSWRYTGKGYEAPKGMSSPFSGYDDIINSLMGHPRCKAEMERQSRAWQKAQNQ